MPDTRRWRGEIAKTGIGTTAIAVRDEGEPVREQGAWLRARRLLPQPWICRCSRLKAPGMTTRISASTKK